MNINENLKKNVLTIDVWVFCLLFYFTLSSIPKINPHYVPPLPTIDWTIEVTMAIMGILCIIGLVVLYLILKFCTKLRNYRYLGIYIQCKKLDSYLNRKILCVLVSMAALFEIYLIIKLNFMERILENWYEFSIVIVYITISVLITFCCSCYLHNSKDLNLNKKE